MGRYKEIESIIDALEKIEKNMKNNILSIEELENVGDTVKALNALFYHAEVINIQHKYDLNNPQEYLLYVDELQKLIDVWKQTILRRRNMKIDAEFWEIYEYFKYVNVENIYQSVVQHFMSLPEEWRKQYISLNQDYTFLENTIDYTQNDFSLIKQYVELVSGQLEKFKWLYEHLEDYRSKVVLNGLLRYWFTFDFNGLYALNETMFSDYYDLDIVDCDKETVMVDLGAYTGDSVLDFVETYKEFKKIYAYEITPSTYEVLVNNMSGYKNIIPINKGVADISGKMFVKGKDYGAGNCLKREEGEIAVDVVTLDEDIQESISIIKMDIEGAEKDAILGAKCHIKNDKPKLLISAYHLPEDIVAIPELIYGIRDDYKFYLRYNGDRQIWPSDYILIAV